MFVSFVERDGLARSVLVLLVITTLGCMSYSWGYYEGFHNARVLVMLEEPTKPITTTLEHAADGAAQRKVHTTDPASAAGQAQMKAQREEALQLDDGSKHVTVPMKGKRGGRLRQGEGRRHRPDFHVRSQEDLALLPSNKAPVPEAGIGAKRAGARKAQKQA